VPWNAAKSNIASCLPQRVDRASLSLSVPSDSLEGQYDDVQMFHCLDYMLDLQKAMRQPSAPLLAFWPPFTSKKRLMNQT